MSKNRIFALTLSLCYLASTCGGRPKASTQQALTRQNSSRRNPPKSPTPTTPQAPAAFSLNGLVSPATVTESIFVFASGVPSGSSVEYYVDDRVVDTESTSPYWLGGQKSSQPNGFSTNALGIGQHTLRVRTVGGSSELLSNSIELDVVPSINSTFSSSLGVYANHLSAQQTPLATILGYTTTPQASLTSAEKQTRQDVLTMYLNWGIDPSLDYKNFQSDVLQNAAPKNWAPPVYTNPLSSPGHLFSPDAPFYQKIPSTWPRVALPFGYVQTFQLNTTQAGDGIGYGLIYTKSTDPDRTITSQWYDDQSTRVVYNFAIPSNWTTYMPWQTQGDMHMIFLNTDTKVFDSTYKTSADPSGDVDALFAAVPTSLNSLGDRGGSTAARFAELPALIRKGESTNANTPIGHAIGGSVKRTWLARVFPGSGWDDGLETSIDSCTGVGYTNRGLVPYGGLIQLDPALDLTKLNLTLPAFRILEAMQQYGYYVMDYGCEDIDIYSSVNEQEWDPYGGLYGVNHKGIGVQYEVQKVLAGNTLYVTVPLTKKQ
jgi:hypothetical protein